MTPSLRIEFDLKHPRTIAVLKAAHARLIEDGEASPSLTFNQFVKGLVCDAIDAIESRNGTLDFRDEDVIALTRAFDREPCIVI